jgi:hypothetical protein
MHMIEKITNGFHSVLLIQLFLVLISILFTAGSCYAGKRDYHRRGGKYDLSFYINFDKARSVERMAKQEKVLKRMQRHYGVGGTNTNFIQEHPKYVNHIRTIELPWACSYLFRIRITDMFNPHIKVKELKIQNRKRKGKRH